mmetsp:Transcript_52217/g.111676  ORF Transcript_52217/g.111676 Transcript_52217/m.111676 type:complete len:510 (-) Transcript_52217:32-1561(-)
MNATIECLRVDGAGSYSQSGRVRAALFVPSMLTTIQFHAEHHRKPPQNGKASCVHALQMFTPLETAVILNDAKRIGSSIGWSDRGVSLPTQDVLVQNLSRESQDSVHRAIREHLLPFARRHYPNLNSAFDKQPYPRPGNLFIVRYSCASQRPGGRGLKLHKDETALTFNLCLSAVEDFTGGGTYFPAANTDVDGLLMRPLPGYCLIHDGNIKHAGNEVRSGDRFILVGFYNADGRDRAGEEQYFGKKAREEARVLNAVAPPVQTVYFTTAVASSRPSTGVPDSGTQVDARPTEGSLVDEASQQQMGVAAAIGCQQELIDRSFKSNTEASSFRGSTSRFPALPSCSTNSSSAPSASKVPGQELSSLSDVRGTLGKCVVTPNSAADPRRHQQGQPSTLMTMGTISSSSASIPPHLRPPSRPHSRPPSQQQSRSPIQPHSQSPFQPHSQPHSRPPSRPLSRPPSGGRFPPIKGECFDSNRPRRGDAPRHPRCLPSWMATIQSRLRPHPAVIK